MGKQNHEFPYKELGAVLRNLRQKRQESLAEVSGAVEIDPDNLNSIEVGEDRPTEDVLLLLISYFDINQEEAANLWQSAGYDSHHMHHHFQDDNRDVSPQPVMVMPIDARIVYTDMAHIMVNDYGVTLNFMQTAGPGGQPLAVARVGMSKDHAKSVLELLQRTLADSEPKQLPDSGKISDK